MNRSTTHRDRVRVSIDDGIAEVILARADKMNALDLPMFEALALAIDQIKADPSVHVVILHGEGRAFCAGLDVHSLGTLVSDGTLPLWLRDLQRRSHGIANLPQYSAWGWQELQVPVIAALHGAVLGGGLQIALGADLRLVHPDAQLSVMEIKWGLVPDVAGCVFLRRLVRDDIARELTYTGRMVAGAEAVALGLATRICPEPLAEARSLARQIAGRSTQAIRAAKQLLNLSHSADAADMLRAEAVAQQELLASPQQLAVLRAGLTQVNRQKAPQASAL